MEFDRRTPQSEDDWALLEFNVKRKFTPSAPIGKADLFSGRKLQIQRIVDAVIERGRHAVIYGERGVGKTSLANTFHDLIADLGAIVTPIRKQASPSDDYNSLWRKVFREIRYEVKEDKGYGAEDKREYSASQIYDQDIIPDDVIRELSKCSRARSPVIIIDEFDVIEDSETRILISHTIKALSDSGVDATLILVGISESVDSLISGHKSIERNIAEIKMPRMNNVELNEILDSRLNGEGMSIAGDARWKIVTLSRGLPEYVHALGREAALNAIRDRRTSISEDDVDRAIGAFLLQSDQSLSSFYKLATDSNFSSALHKHVLLACALTRTDIEGRFMAKDVVEPLSRILGSRVGISKFQSHLTAFSGDDRGQVLERSGKPRAYKYRFREPKMQPYVIMKGIEDSMVTDSALQILASPEQPRLSKDF